MRSVLPIVVVIVFACMAFFSEECRAVVDISGTIRGNSAIRQETSLKNESVGFFGGIKNANRLQLFLSPGSVLYFGINDTTKALMDGRQVSVSQIPLNARIRVVSERGIALEVHVMEGDK